MPLFEGGPRCRSQNKNDKKQDETDSEKKTTQTNCGQLKSNFNIDKTAMIVKKQK
jgi:hypothetical protein